MKDKEVDFDGDGKIILEKNNVYVFEAQESLNLENTGLSGQATGKSTFGRIDILTRLLMSYADSYDTVQINSRGPLWVEITPITFNVKLKRGMSLNQLRLYKGEPNVCRINNEDLGLWGNSIFDDDGGSVKFPENLTLNLKADPKLGDDICAYVAKESEKDDVLDLTIDLKAGEFLRTSKYWQPLKPNVNKPLAIEIRPERFYILRSKERFMLSKSVAIYCQAVAETLGELRIHYAGFVHPRFGEGRSDKKGAPLIFEVRGHNVKAFLQDGETLARLEYFFMSEDAEPYQCGYSEQGLKLSRYFKEEAQKEAQ